jgi:hypothetical protein
MALNLVRKFSRNIKGGDSFEIPILFRQEYLLISAKCRNCRSTWYKAGYLSQIVDILPLKKVQIASKILVPLNNPQLQTFAFFTNGYKLKFEAVNWIDSLTLEIYLPNMSLFQSEPSATPNPGDFTGQSAPALFALSVTAVSVLAANPNRKGLVVRNKGNKIAYLGFVATVDANTAPFSIPGGTTLEETDDFPPGQLFMVAPAGNTDVVVMEIF